MTSPLRYVYVATHDGGCEGHSPPIQAFDELDEAKAVCQMAYAMGADSIALYRVPVWPLTSSERWHGNRDRIDFMS